MSRKPWRYLYITLILALVLVTKNVVGVTCEFCNKEFIHLSKQTWRCNRSLISSESLVTVNDNNETITCVDQDLDPENEKSDHEFRCYCGRSFNSLRGLNTHRRTCFVGESPDVKNLFKDAVEEIVNDATNENDEIIDYEDLPKELIKRGVILLNTVQEWENANEYFRVKIHHNNEIGYVIKEINHMQNKIYDYFPEKYGQVKDKEINN